MTQYNHLLVPIRHKKHYYILLNAINNLDIFLIHMIRKIIFTGYENIFIISCDFI